MAQVHREENPVDPNPLLARSPQQRLMRGVRRIRGDVRAQPRLDVAQYLTLDQPRLRVGLVVQGPPLPS